MVKVNKNKNLVNSDSKEDFEKRKKEVELKGKIKAVKDGVARTVTKGTGVFVTDHMLVYREKDATWYYGESRILDNDRHVMNGQKVYEVRDFDRVLDTLRIRNKFQLGIANMIIWKDYDTQDELVGWADPNLQ